MKNRIALVSLLMVLLVGITYVFYKLSPPPVVTKIVTELQYFDGAKPKEAPNDSEHILLEFFAGPQDTTDYDRPDYHRFWKLYSTDSLNFDMSKYHDTMEYSDFVRSYGREMRKLGFYRDNTVNIWRMLDTYLIDFNDDGQKDIILFGEGDNDDWETRLLLNKGNHFEQVFLGQGEIFRMEVKSGKLEGLALKSKGGGSWSIWVMNRHYRIEYDKMGYPRFLPDSAIGYTKHTEKPIALLSPLPIRIQAERAALRCTKRIYDSPFDEEYGWLGGNVIAKHFKGANGNCFS